MIIKIENAISKFLPKQRDSSRAPSAVVILLVKDKNDVIELLLLRRNSQMRTYAGDWCFPGGRLERQDSKLENTAWRELREETGVLKETTKLIGQLSDFYDGGGNLVRPFVMVTMKESFERTFFADPEEVFCATLIPWKNIENIVEGSPVGKVSRRSPAYLLEFEYNQELEYLWGLSASILMHLNNVTGELSMPIDFGENFFSEKGDKADVKQDKYSTNSRIL